METQLATSPSQRYTQKLKHRGSFSIKRPDSMKIELISIPENSKISSFKQLDKKSDSIVSVGFKNISCTVNVGYFKRSK